MRVRERGFSFKLIFILGLFLLFLYSLYSPLVVFAQTPEDMSVVASAILDFAYKQGKDFYLDCGTKDVFAESSYKTPNDWSDSPIACVLNMTNKIAIGMYVEGSIVDLLETFSNTTIYGNHIDKRDIKKDACEDVEGEGFIECDNAIKNMYVYYNPQAQVILISEEKLTSINIIDNIVLFFKRLLGIETKEEHFLPSGYSEEYFPFSKGYFAFKKATPDLKVYGFYYLEDEFEKEEAYIIFENFGVNFEEIAKGLYNSGKDVEFMFGSGNKQVLILKTAEEELWKSFTGSLRLEDTGEPPIAGDSCGNNKVGFDEDCDPPGTTQTTCQDLEYDGGTISCSQQCTYNVSKCITCNDEDNDGYSTGDGFTSNLDIINKINFGFALPKGVYDKNDEIFQNFKSLKTKLDVKFEFVPIFYDFLIPPSSQEEVAFNSLFDDFKTEFEKCSDDFIQCEVEALKKPEIDNKFKETTSFIARRFNSQIPQSSLCSFNENSIDCPNGMNPYALGIKSYVELLSGMALSKTKPIVGIVKGGCVQGCGPYSSGYNSPFSVIGARTENDYKIREFLFCALAAKAINNFWNSENVEGEEGITYFVSGLWEFAANNGEGSGNANYQSYLNCKAAIESTNSVGGEAVVLLSMPNLNDPSYSRYKDFVVDENGDVEGISIQTTPSYSGYEKSVIDAIKEKEELKDKTKIFINQYYKTQLDKPTLLWGVLPIVEQAIAGFRIILMDVSYNTEEESSIANNDATSYRYPAFSAIKNVISFFKIEEGEVLLISKEETDIKIVVKTKISSESPKTKIMILNPFNEEKESGLDLSKCGEAKNIIKKILNSETNSENLANYNLNDVENIKVPANSILFLELNEEPGCFTEFDVEAGTGVCGLLVDCDDENGEVYPSAKEKCDGIDNDCDNNIDEECSVDGGGVYTCNYDGKCESGEDEQLCSDCATLFCPTTKYWEKLSEPISIEQSDYEVRTGWKWDGENSLIEIRYVGSKPECSLIEDSLKLFFSENELANGKEIYREGSFSVKVSAITSDGKKGYSFVKSGTPNSCWNDVQWENNKYEILIEDNVCIPAGSCGDGGWFCSSDEDCCEETATGQPMECHITINAQGERYPVCGIKGGGGGGCFTPDTLITTYFGYKEISDIKVGDNVLSYDTENGKIVYNPVTKIFAHNVTEILIINSMINTTGEHRFYTKRGWVASEELKIGDEILREDGTWISIVSKTKRHGEFVVYNLDVASTHNFFANGLLAHNMKKTNEEEETSQSRKNNEEEKENAMPPDERGDYPLT